MSLILGSLRSIGIVVHFVVVSRYMNFQPFSFTSSPIFYLLLLQRLGHFEGLELSLTKIISQFSLSKLITVYGICSTRMLSQQS